MHNTLFLQRLRIVTYENRVAYDEPFHRGVNIIRGQNSSGKSTVVRFIFFVLGGYYSDFVPQAMRCRYVMAEVCINGHVITLKRYLERRDDGKVNPQAPIYIHFGPMAEVVSSSKIQVSSDAPETWNLKPETWQKFGYNTSAEHRSFSNVLFELLGYPELRADSNITMHQVLRLIYLDQESPVNSLFFYEQFDKEIYRETVANLLLGLYDQKYSQAKLDLQATVKALAEVKVSIRNVGEFLQDPRTKSSAYIRSQIDTLNDEIARMTQQIQFLRSGEMPQVDTPHINIEIAQVSNINPNANIVINNYKSDDEDSSDEVELRIVKSKPTNNPKLSTDSKLSTLNSKLNLEHQRLQAEIVRQRKECATLESEIKQLETEIEDSGYFIDALNKRIEAVRHSIATRDYFDSMHLDFCPECLTRIEPPADADHCPLCKSPIDSSKGKSQALRIRLELEFQVRESIALKEENERQLEEKKAQLRRQKRQLTASQRHYDDAVSYVRSTHEERIDKLLQDKGFKEGEILQYRTLLEQAEKYETLLEEERKLKAKESELRRYIEATENRIRQDRQAIDAAVSESGVYLLRKDENRQDEFMRAQEFVIDYSQNMAYISNQRIKLSASSAFYLKMVARFALLFASLKVDSMMYPRLLFSDNMEDKGLEPDRAVKFQKTVVQMLKEYEEKEKELSTNNLKPETCNLKPEYQLIFATSMIAPELNKPEYTVGDYYTRENKSLRNV